LLAGCSNQPESVISSDPDLARVIDRWDHLSEHIRKAILTIIDSATS